MTCDHMALYFSSRHVICTILLPFDDHCYGMTPVGGTLLIVTPLMGDYLSMTHYAALITDPLILSLEAQSL